MHLNNMPFRRSLSTVALLLLLPQMISASPREDGFQWLGALPADQTYSTRAMKMSGDGGVIVRTRFMLSSHDGGRSWVRVKDAESPASTNSAWITNSFHVLRLSGDLLFVNLTPTAKARRISLRHTNIGYLATAASEDLQQIIVVGRKSVPTSSQDLETLPQYARDSTVSSPRMISPEVFVSDDGGRNWQSVDVPEAVGYLDSVEVFGRDAIAWGPYVVYASRDAGKSWKIMKMDIPDLEDDAYPVSGFVTANHVFISLKNGRLLLGDIAGQSLEPLARLPSAIGKFTVLGSCLAFGVSPSTTDDEDVLMESEDGGLEWKPVLREKRIVALTGDGSYLFGLTSERAFRLHVDDKKLKNTCKARTVY